MNWANEGSLAAKSFDCGHCGRYVASVKGYHSTSNPPHFIYICPNCKRANYFTQDSTQIPGVPPGKEVEHLPPDISALYREARNSVAANAFTGAVLICRKLLMNISVSLGAKAGDTFVSYIEFLSAQGYVPQTGKDG